MSRLFAIGLDATKSHRVPVTGRKMFVDIPLHRTHYLNLRYAIRNNFRFADQPDSGTSLSEHLVPNKELVKFQVLHWASLRDCEATLTLASFVPSCTETRVGRQTALRNDQSRRIVASENRRLLMSCIGGNPKKRLYSRLNWLGLSYPTSKAALAASSPLMSIRSRAATSRSCF